MEKILFISPSTLDRKSLILTLVVCVVPTLGLGWLFYRNLATNHVLALILGITAAMFLLIFVLGGIITPYKYILTNYEFIIKRHFKDIVIPLENIKIIRLMTADDKQGMLRTFGAEGCFGSWGYFQSARHKKLIVFARRYDNRTIIVTDRKKYVIAPDDLQLIEAVAQQIGQTEADIRAMDVPAKQWRERLPAAIVVGTLVILFISSIGAIRDTVVEINDERLIIKGSYGLSVPLPEIEHIDTVSNLPNLRRVNGYGLAGTLRGYCKLSDGTRVKVFLKTKHKPYILIHSKNIKEPIYLNFRDRQKTINLYHHLNSK